MDTKRKIAILLYLHVREETLDSEENEIALWRAESPENENLYLQLTDMDWVANYIRNEREENEGFENWLKMIYHGEKAIRRREKTLQEYHEEDLAKWPHSKQEYWINEMETDEAGQFGESASLREYFEELLTQAGLPKLDPKKKIAALLYLHVRNETNEEEEKEIHFWKGRSAANDSLYSTLTSREYVVHALWKYKKYFPWGAKEQTSLSRKFYTRDTGFASSPVDPGKASEISKMFEKHVKLANVTKVEYCVAMLNGMDKLVKDNLDGEDKKDGIKKATIVDYFNFLLCIALLPGSGKK